MTKDRVLVQWIGHSDLRAMAASLPVAEREEFSSHLGGRNSESGNDGPTKTLLQTQRFEEVHLLSNYPERWNQKFVQWLDKDAKIVTVDLQKPTDYSAIFKIAETQLSAIQKRRKGSKTELCLHLSPGTPAMAAIWLLLGKTRFPATFYETFAGKSWITQIPFDLTVDVLPEILRAPDVHLQHLASESPSEIEGFQEIIGDSPSLRDAVGRAKRASLPVDPNFWQHDSLKLPNEGF
jgi:hypothetical protein